VRTATALAFMSLHVGIWLTMDVGLFSWNAALCMVCFFPTWFWDQAARLNGLVSGRSNLAHRLRRAGTHLVHAYWTPVQTRFLRVAGAAQPSVASLAGLSQHPELTTRTWRGEIRPATRATDGAEMHHGTPAGYGPTMLRSSLATNLLALLFLVYVFLWNLAGASSSFTMPERLWPPATFLGLDQNWGMFAPAPPKGDLWHVIPGRLQDGRQVDLLPVAKGDFSMHELSWAKPPYVRELYRNERWRKYLENISNNQWTDQRLYFGQYICREWNARHTGAEQLRTFEIAYMWQETFPNYRQGAPQKVVLWQHSCF